MGPKNDRKISPSSGQQNQPESIESSRRKLQRSINTDALSRRRQCSIWFPHLKDYVTEDRFIEELQNSKVVDRVLLKTHSSLKGAPRYDVRKMFRFVDPLPPCLHLDLIYTMKFTQHPLLLYIWFLMTL